VSLGAERIKVRGLNMVMYWRSQYYTALIEYYKNKKGGFQNG
jgi:hypothetical protein